MFRNTRAFFSFSVDDIPRAKAFYGETLGLEVSERSGYLEVTLADGERVMLYPKKDHKPATFTVLNFSVADVHTTVDQLKAAGVKFEQYDLPDIKTDAKGIARMMGSSMAWFTDPAGNILSVLEEQS